MSTPTDTKSKGTDKKPGRKPGQPAKVWDYTGLDANFLADPQGVTAELTSLAAPTRARDDRQVAIDKTVATLYDEYKTAQKPDRWATMPKRSYHVDPKAADTLRMMVRRAANFLGVSVRFGGSVRDDKGREIVVFAVREPRVKADKGKSTWTLEELRAFALEFWAEDTEGATEFLAALTGEEGPEEAETDTDTDGETSEADTENGEGATE
jgi:hypothetical protein